MLKLSGFKNFLKRKDILASVGFKDFIEINIIFIVNFNGRCVKGLRETVKYAIGTLALERGEVPSLLNSIDSAIFNRAENSDFCTSFFNSFHSSRATRCRLNYLFLIFFL